MPTFSGAGTSGFYWVVPPTVMEANIHRMRRRTLISARNKFEDFAEEVEDWMKNNHPWNNDTGTAEASLKADVTSAIGDIGSGRISSSELEMSMEIGYDLGILRGHPDGRQRDYSIYLEGYLGLGIILPTMAVKAPEAMDLFEGIMTL